MSHNIWNDGQKDAMFCVGDRAAAWHGLGQRTPDAQNWEHAMQLASLDWEVVLKPVYAHNPLGAVAELPAKGVFRVTDGAILGVVGMDYAVIQNRQAFDFVDSLLDASGGAHYESAGALGVGEKIWCLARVPAADFTVAGTDRHESYLLFTTAHDGTGAAVAKLTDTRVVCQNTLTVALSSNGQSLRIRHTKNATTRMEIAQRVMVGVVKDAQMLAKRLESLAQRRVTRESAKAIFDRLFPKPPEEQNQTRRDNVVAEVLTLYQQNDGVYGIEAVKGTAYNLLNAVTEYTDHFRSARLTEDRVAAGYTLEKARAENALWGTGERLKTTALSVIEEETEGVLVRVRPALPPAELKTFGNYFQQ